MTESLASRRTVSPARTQRTSASRTKATPSRAPTMADLDKLIEPLLARHRGRETAATEVEAWHQQIIDDRDDDDFIDQRDAEDKSR